MFTDPSDGVRSFTAAVDAFTLDAAWRLHPQTVIRPEHFGALLYHFGTRRLSFLKSPTLLAVVQELGDAPTARVACERAGVRPEELDRYRRALSALAASLMVVRGPSHDGCHDTGR